jgi:hypothetical protein
VIKVLAAAVGVAAALAGAAKMGETAPHIYNVKVYIGKPFSELEVGFVSDEHGSCHAGSHRGHWRLHFLCNDGTYKEL